MSERENQIKSQTHPKKGSEILLSRHRDVFNYFNYFNYIIRAGERDEDEKKENRWSLFISLRFKGSFKVIFFAGRNETLWELKFVTYFFNLKVKFTRF